MKFRMVWLLEAVALTTLASYHKAQASVSPRLIKRKLCAVTRELAEIKQMLNSTVNGAWNNWGSWSECSSSCGQGLSKRQRSCNNPTPTFGGLDCPGDATEYQGCEIGPCPQPAGSKSAFTVWNPASTSGNKIRMTTVGTNIGGHYDTSSGDFTCVIPGIYAFHLHIYMKTGQSSAKCYITKNGSQTTIAEVDTTNSGYFGGSTSAIFSLVAGDIVNLDGCSGIGTFQGGKYTSFSGFLVQEEPDR